MVSETFQHIAIQFSDKPDIEIVHNFSNVHGRVDSLMAAAENWLSRTEEHTPESLANYINNKGTHTAYMVGQYEQLTGTKLK